MHGKTNIIHKKRQSLKGKRKIMDTNNKALPERNLSGKIISLHKSRDYDRNRFTTRRRMRKLDAFEKSFAIRLFEMVGTDSAIIDIPCGNGRFCDVFSTAGKLIAADYSENMLTAFRERIGNVENVKTLQADITQIPLPDKCVDLAFSMRLFHHMKNDAVRSAALKELSRISRKYVAFSFYNKRCIRYLWRKSLGKKIRGNYVTLDHYIELAQDAGLELVSSYRYNIIEQQSLVLFKKSEEP